MHKMWYSVSGYTVHCKSCNEEHIFDVYEEGSKTYENIGVGIVFTCKSCGAENQISFSEMSAEIWQEEKMYRIGKNNSGVVMYLTKEELIAIKNGAMGNPGENNQQKAKIRKLCKRV